MKKILCIMALLTLPLMAKAALFAFNAEDGLSASTAASATVGDDLAPLYDSTALADKYITTISGGGSSSPGSAANVASYEVTFPEAGTYDLYVRAYLGPNGASDDSMFYGNGFGVKDPTTDADWVLRNGNWGVPNEQYFWANISEEAPFTVPSAGTYTFQVGAREDGFRMDAFAFGTTGELYSDAVLDAEAGDPLADVLYSTSPTYKKLVESDTDIVLTAVDGSVNLASVLDYIEMKLVVDGITNDTSSSVISAVTSSGMTFSYTEDLVGGTDIMAEFTIYRTDAETDSIKVSFSTLEDDAYILVCGVDPSDDQTILDFLSNNFQNVNAIYGDYSDYSTHSNLIVNSELFIVGRSVNSGAFDNSENSAAFNALTNPVVSFTSYVTRPDGSRWGWHSGGIGDAVRDDEETTVTPLGSTVFGLAEGTYDWFEGSGNFSRSGTGTLGNGELLATIGVNGILAAHWEANTYSAMGALFGGERLLFNLHDGGGLTQLPTGTGKIALIKALATYTPLVPANEFIAVTSPEDGDTDVSRDSDIVVTVSDVGINWSSLIESYEMKINSSVVSATMSTVNGVTTFTHTPPVDLEIDTSYDVQLEVVRTDSVTNTVNFTFATAPIYLMEVLVSGINEGNDQSLIDFLHNNFKGPIKITYGDFSNFPVYESEINNADLFMIGRNVSSSAYDDLANSAAFNALTTPVVAFTSYVARNEGNRWGWHSGSNTSTNPVTGAESTVTAAGAGVFNVVAGAYDWYTGSNTLATAGIGTVGTGEILATIGPDIVAAHWSAGDQTALGASMGGERLLFNLDQLDGVTTVMPVGDGAKALIKALDAYTPLQAFAPDAPDIMIAAAGPGSVSVFWATESGVSYILQSTPLLTAGKNWQTIGTALGNGSTYSTNITTGFNTEFFRLEVQ